MVEIIKACGINITKNEKGELLLKLCFKALGKEGDPDYSWMPQWETVRELLFSAIVVETLNRQGTSEQLDLFSDCLNLCLKVSSHLADSFTGEAGRER